MKQRLLCWTAAMWCTLLPMWGQLPNGSTAPNFTVVDIDGNSHNLYNLLNQGKTVYLDFFATWCGPCWSYHNSNALKDLWNQYGPPGTNEAFVIMIEGDCNTNTACINNPPACNASTQGNWAAGTPYPIADDCGVRQLYQVAYYPTIYMVCPADKKIYEVGQQSASGLWAARSTYCPPLVVDVTVNSVQNVRCYGTSTGSIDISASGGNPPYTYQWSNGATTQDLINIPAGEYSCTVTNAQGWTGTIGPIEVLDPPAPLELEVVATSPVGCNGVFGSIEVASSGGWDNHVYAWSNGYTGTRIEGLTAGTYTCTVTDERGCTKTVTQVMPAPTNPVASIAPPGVITCATPTIQLSGSASGGYSNSYLYQWFASNGGNFVSGANTPNPIVDAAGTYILQVTEEVTNCRGFATTVVTADVALPDANAGADTNVTCWVPQVQLQGTASSGSNFFYVWTAIQGGHIVSGDSTLTPIVDSGGYYILRVTNTANGCIRRDTVYVVGNNVPPAVDIEHGPLTCTAPSVVLTTTTNAGLPYFTWTGPENFESTEPSPEVSIPGAYALMVFDSATGCLKLDTTVVAVDTMPPGAETTGGTLSCAVDSTAIQVQATSSHAVFAWTGPEGFESTLPNPVVAIGGTYAVVVTDTLNGCTASATALVQYDTLPPAASATAPGTLNCNTAQLTLDGSGSAQGNQMSYLWSTADGHIVSGDTTLYPVVDAPGTYVLTVSNSVNGCTNTASATVIQRGPVNVTAAESTPISCFGSSNGAATATAGGGSGQFAFLWSDGQETASATGLSAGTYTVTVTDSEGCSATATLVLQQPPALDPNASATPQTAANTNDGTATAQPEGGTGTYEYAWSNGETTQTITGLAPGVYTVTVTDANECTAAQSVVVNAFNCTLSATVSVTHITCFGANDGAATVTVSGANEPVSYLWSTGHTEAAVAGLSPGTYTVRIVDDAQCAEEVEIAIQEPAKLQANAVATGETRVGGNDGTAAANPTGGTGSYTYTWSTGDTTPTLAGLSPGTYTVTVADENGCTAVQAVEVAAFACALSAQPTVAHVRCFGQNNGALSVVLTGGTAPYTYLWSTGETTPALQNLAPGSYTASITDADGCAVVVESVVEEPAPLELSAQLEHPTCANEPSGSIQVTATGGTGAYTYDWSNGDSDSRLEQVPAGTYTLRLTDANGCSAQASFELTPTDAEPPAIAVQNTLLLLGSNGIAEVSTTTLQAVISDNCAVETVRFEPEFFDCSQQGLQTVTIYAIDNAGNQALFSTVVEVADNTPPVVICPGDIAVCWYENTVPYAAPTAQDNCPLFNGTWTLEEGLPSGSEFPVGTTVQTFRYTDDAGNAGRCSFAVTVTPPIALPAPAVTHDVNSQSMGAIDISPSGGTPPYEYVWTNELGNVVGTEEDLRNIPAGRYTVTIRDVNGCVLVVRDIAVDNIVGTREPAWMQGVVLWPNPSDGVAELMWPTAAPAEVEIVLLDATGRLLQLSIARHQNRWRIDAAHLPAGVYWLRIRSEKSVGMRKWVIAR